MMFATKRPPITLDRIRMAFVMEKIGKFERPLAIMIDVPWNPCTSKTDVATYGIMDQHSSCDIEYARTLRDATQRERAQLEALLKAIYEVASIEVVPVATTATWEKVS
jgi:hypothetical protein